MSHTVAKHQPRRVGAAFLSMRSKYLLTVRRWAVSLNGYPSYGACKRLGLLPAAASELSTAASTATPSEVPELVLWVQHHRGRVDGATLANLAGRDGGSGWGLKASQDAEQGQRLILLPASCHLTFSSQDDPKLLAVIDQVPGELWGAKLALQLLAQRLRGPDSRFATYVSHLPQGVPGIPMFFSKRAIDLIDYPPVSQQVQKRCQWLFTFSRDVLAKLPGSPADPFGGVAVDINALGWAMACVTSRAFRTRGPTQPAAMLPLVDMANHCFEPNVEVLPLPDEAVGLFAKRKIEAGDPLLLSYGKLSNDFLFMDYGFIVPDNPYDTVQLRFDTGLLQGGCLVANVTHTDGSSIDLSPKPWKLALLAQLSLAGPAANTELNLGGPELLDPRLLAAARVMVARQEGEVVGRGVDRLCAVSRPLSRENELPALRIVAGVLAVALSNFRTTLDQDLALLAGDLAAAASPQQAATDGGEAATAPVAPPLEPLASEDEVLAVRFRVEKKRILSRALRHVAELMNGCMSGAGGVRESTGVGKAKKGTKPSAATSKGFGKK